MLTSKIAGLLALAVAAVAATGHLATAGDEDKPAADMAKYIECGTPGEGHAHLERIVGDWSGEFTIWMGPDQAARTSSGTVSREWVLDGRFVRETVTATTDWGTFQGLGYFGFNNLDGRYELVWMESMSTAMATSTATFDTESEVLSVRGTGRDPASGKVIQMRGTWDLSKPDRHTYLGYVTGPDGREYKHFEGTTVRN